MTATKSRKSSKTTKASKPAKAKTPRKPPAPKLYMGAPIACERLFVRKMDEFKNCEAWAWMAIGTDKVTYANSYGPDYGQLRSSYDPHHYSYPLNEKVVKPKMDSMKELEPTEFPPFFTTAAPVKRTRKSK